MQSLRSKLGAWWLLLLLGRVMAPEAAVLSLHTHHHTVEASTRPAVRKSGGSQAEISAQHQHCHAEQLYDAPFQLALSPCVPLPPVGLSYPAYQVVAGVYPARHLLPGAALRGPPVT
ncbi:MAG: hypothetical protein H7Z21_17725 [Hymenobacter sp.]|nr:hypothetical protein [Hymenobacter sp.]